MIEPSFIYAFESGGVILYVGHTVDPHERLFFHTRATASRIRTRLPSGFRFRILRAANTDSGDRIERQIVLSLKRKGMAQLNSRNGCRHLIRVGGNMSRWRGIIFSSISQMERYKRHKKRQPPKRRK